MGARSAEALARRAAKRGRSVEEEIQAERKKDKEKKSRGEQRSAEKAEAPAGMAVGDNGTDDQSSKKPRTVGIDVWKAKNLEVVQSAGKLKRDAKAGWVCTAVRSDTGRRCDFINFPHRATCWQCDAQRYGGHTPSKQHKQQAERTAAAKTRRQEKVSDPSRAWAGTTDVPAERLEENKRLREALAKNPDSLSAEERERAEALVARDERKRAKKEEIRKAKGLQSQRHAVRKEEFRDNRRQQAVSGKEAPKK